MPQNVKEGVVVSGLTDMQRVLKKGGSELGPELKKRLKDVGEGIVAPVARRYAPQGVRSARYRFSGPSLHESIRAGATQKGATVYSTSVYGGVQNFGGKVGRNHATLLKRADVSQYMTRAVRETRVPVTRHVEGTLDWLTRELTK